MERYPKNLELTRSLDLKLGIKSSIPKVKASIALIYFLWKSNNKPSELYYSKEESDKNNNTILKFSENVKNNLISFLEKLGLINDSTKSVFLEKVDTNSIFNSQIESLKVTFELVWKLAKFTFVNSDLSFSAERSKVAGKTVRYKKKMEFSNVLDLIDIVIEENKSKHYETLFKWIVNENSEEKGSLVKLFTILSDEAIFRLRIAENQDIKFNMAGIYEVVDSKNPVIVSDYKENMGSLRILGSILREDFNFFVTKESQNSKTVTLNDVNEEELKSYATRINTHFELLNIDLSLIDDTHFEKEKITDEGDGISPSSIDKPHQRIFFGAPGTGKSYQLNKEAQKYFGNNFERVTFHPNYMYGNFVGAFKPYPKKIKENGQKKEVITYEYVEGILMRLLVKALSNPDKNYLLLIEEINRANVAAVFGDIFQLLDRDENGKSEYSIVTSKDQRLFLEKFNDEIRGDKIKNILGENFEELYLPSNFYIWATMNSADQGVLPMDTAFRRRWDFTYLGIDDAVEENRASFDNYRIKVSSNETALWNDFRMAVNKKLVSMNISEDKLIGPFFISKNVLDNATIEQLTNVVKNKVIMYLYEDVAKGRRSELFEENKYSTYSEACKYFEIDAKNLFRGGLELNTKEY